MAENLGFQQVLMGLPRNSPIPACHVVPDAAWIARATSSLPVPVSPSTRTLVGVSGNDFNKLFQFLGRCGLANYDVVYRAALTQYLPTKKAIQTIGVNILEKHSEIMPSLSKF